MEANKQSIDSLVSIKEQKPDIPKQNYHLRSCNNIKNETSFMGGKQPIKHRSERKHGPINDVLSQDIQKEAMDYLLQLKKQSMNFDHTDKFIFKQTLNKTIANGLSNSVSLQNGFTYRGKYLQL